VKSAAKFAFAALIALTLAACPHRASAAASTAPPPPPPPRPPPHITKYIDLASPTICTVVSLALPALLP
jgi:hypothetical protein